MFDYTVFRADSSALQDTHTALDDALNMGLSGLADMFRAERDRIDAKMVRQCEAENGYN